MEIFWHGESSFSVTSSKVNILFDPKDTDFKGKVTKEKRIVIRTDPSRARGMGMSIKPKNELSKIFDRPGEYEISGLMLQGIPAFGEGGESDLITMFTLRAEGMAVAHLSRIKQKSLTENQLSELNGIDILLVPVGGKNVLSGKEASEIVSEIDPRIVIPMYYKAEGKFPGYNDASEFLKAEGAKNMETRPSFKIEKKRLPIEEREVVLLEAKP